MIPGPNITKQPVSLPYNQLTLSSSLKKKKMSKEQHDSISRAITRFVVKEMQPFSIISSSSFREILRELNPEFIPPNKETISSIYVPSWYNVEMQKLQTELASTEAVAITADHWTSLGGDHYLTVTAHFIKDWTLQNKVLQTKAVYESQTGEAISLEITECLISFGIKEKVVAITVDNAANMAVGANVLNVLRVPCFAHSMNVSAGKLYKETAFTRWLARIRTVVLWFKRVHMAGVVLKEKLVSLELPNHNVILDVKTRWNSMYLMVERFAEIYPGLSAATRDQRLKKRIDKDKVDKITDEDLKKSEEFVECMKILYTSTLAVSTDKMPTIGQVLPTWLKLQKCFTVQPDDSPFIKMVKTAVWNDMKKRYQDEEVHHFLEEAAALDPRFKAKMMNEEDVWDRLQGKITEMIKTKQATEARQPNLTVIKPDPDGPENPEPTQPNNDTEITTDEVEITEESASLPVLKRSRTAIEELFCEDEDSIMITRCEAPPTPELVAQEEIEMYKRVQGIKFNVNPLSFYDEHKSKFPWISALSLRYFCVPASSVPSERIFSLAGNIISQERVRLDPEKADMLIFLHKNAD